MPPRRAVKWIERKCMSGKIVKVQVADMEMDAALYTEFNASKSMKY